jgi:hypothetical protein
LDEVEVFGGLLDGRDSGGVNIGRLIVVGGSFTVVVIGGVSPAPGSTPGLTGDFFGDFEGSVVVGGVGGILSFFGMEKVAAILSVFLRTTIGQSLCRLNNRDFRY